ncbi:glycosyltransferase [Mucilaginibacter jinjuensis]|uniref:Glycosyltransferase n=1 Tax=Mucilaginibacter jinjuensis TaxID=1176721 RepID=A0ABY7TAH8_9SPHI|nr:glycosyltransferase [Mucilaginibacter jinjuensis]WCT13213.1 glycosyltransferase [Mucilaginibacter jinjuensis]
MALINKVIVILANTRFDSAIRATSLFVARNLAKNNKVYFVDYPFTLKDYFTHKNSIELKVRKPKFSLLADGVLDTDIDNFKVIIAPPVVPINFLPEGVIFRTALKANEAIISKRIKKVLKKAGVQKFILINSFNFHYPNIAKSIKPILSVYQCVDPMIVPYDMKHGIISENMLVKESDVVICTSKALYNEKKSQNPNTYFVPNAADIEHCSKALNAGLPVHPKIKDLPKPIIGYLGTLERRMDYNLLLEVVKANPEKTFVLAGPVWDNHVPAEFFKTPNVHIIGTIPYSEVPQLVKGFDVAIIPFKKDEVSSTIFPLKLFEYLCAGKPVVVTDFNPDLKDYTADTVTYAGTPDLFTIALNEAIANNNEAEIAKRTAIAKLNTWEKRSDDIAEIISKHLD